MHIFITGVAGFLGQTYRLLSQKIIKSQAMTLRRWRNRECKQRCKFFNIACEDLEGMTKVMKGVDLVCRVAAYAHEGLSSFSPTLICSNNITGSTSVFTAAIKNNVKRIVYCSSMARYGDIATPFKETD